MKKNLSIAVLVIIVVWVVRALFDRSRYGTFMHFGWMQGMMQPNNGSMMGDSMMQHTNISSEEEFIKHMIPHHQEAVDTASRLTAMTQNPELKELTANISAAQENEITMMNGWIQRRYATGTVQSCKYNLWWEIHQHWSAITTIEKMRLEDMIQHHMGAIMMAKLVLKLSPRAEVEAFAQNVIIRTVYRDCTDAKDAEKLLISFDKAKKESAIL
jgi:uncharacterized protein (DUF305 family)